MKTSDFHKAMHKANKEIATLNRHLQCVQSKRMTHHIQNEIAKERVKLRLIMQKAKAQPQAAPKKTLDSSFPLGIK
jgi:hypothetical protein